jgi:hypothetical protein
MRASECTVRGETYHYCELGPEGCLTCLETYPDRGGPSAELCADCVREYSSDADDDD